MGGDGGKYCLLDNAGKLESLVVGMFTGALSDRKRPFERWVPGIYIGGDGEGEGENVGDGQYSSKLVVFLWAIDVPGGWGGRLVGGNRREAGLEIEAFDSECVGEGEKETEGEEAL